jgi:hypothetical protein
MLKWFHPRNGSTRGKVGEAETLRSAAEGGSGNIEIAVLIPLVLVANIIVATIAWYVVGSLLK